MGEEELADAMTGWATATKELVTRASAAQEAFNQIAADIAISNLKDIIDE